MIREQQILKDLVDNLGEELNEFISTFYLCKFWVYKEDEVIVDKTFKRIVSIIANYNLTTADEVLGSVYKTIESNNEAMMYILGYLRDNYLQNGSENLLNRILIFCYTLFELSVYEKKKATEILIDIYNSELISKEETKWTKFKYTIGFSSRPYKCKVHLNGIGFVSLLRGLSVKDSLDYVVQLIE